MKTKKRIFIDKDARGKRGVKRIIDHGLNEGNIIRIHSQLHRIGLSGFHKYKKIKKELGDLYLINNYIPEKRMSMYDKKYIKQLRGGKKLTIFLNPNKPGVPPCYIEWAYVKKDFLIWLHNKLSMLQVSKLEYANDVYCHDNELFFDVVTWHLYISYGKEAQLIADNKNRRFRINPSIKVYERGADNKKRDGSWSVSDIDRVRLEYQCKRNVLREKIRFLLWLIEDPKFFEMNNDKYKFCKFSEGTKKLPSYWMGYNAEDKNKNKGAFHQQYVIDRNTIKNIAQYRRNIDEFNPFLYRLISEMTNFDKKWKTG